MLEDVLPWLACPHCGGRLRPSGASLVCSAGHNMNVARQGYVSLLGRDSGTHTADSAEMVAARERVLAGGLFDPLLERVAATAAELDRESVPGPVLDLGSGPGRYLAAVLDALPHRAGIAVDNSRYAARRAARAHARAGAVLADIWDLIPVRKDSVALLVNVFAPRNGAELARVMHPEGGSLVVTPGPDHLHELVEPFRMIGVDPDKEERLEQSLEGLGQATASEPFHWEMAVDRRQVADLVGMGPSAGRLSGISMEEALAGITEPVTVTGSVRIRTGRASVSGPSPAGIHQGETGY